MRLIDADSLKGVVDSRVYHNHNGIIKIIDEQPTINTASSVHAHWMMTCDTLKKCSNCGYDFMPTSLQHYCPHCGAKMDEEKNNG